MGSSNDRVGILKGDALKVLPDLDLDSSDRNVDESKVPLTRSNVYADSPRETHLSEGITETEIVLRQRVGIAFVLVLVLASAICVMLLSILGHEEITGILKQLMGLANNNTYLLFATFCSSTPAIQHHFIAATSADGFKKNLELYTNTVRHTGSSGDYEMANFIRSSAIDFGFEESHSKIDEFEMLVNVPETLTLDIVQMPNNKSLASYDFIAEHAARLAKQAKGKNVTKPYASFHLYSKNGTVSGPVVYAHFGSSDDYKALASNNVVVVGKIVLVRMGGDVSLAAKVIIASKFGAVGVLTYTDPADDGSGRGPTAPDGPWRPSSTTSFGSVYMGDGDPTMPESFSGDRLSVDDVYSINNTFNILPPIVSMPISAVVAQDLLSKIESASNEVDTISAADVFRSRWEGGGLGVEYKLPVGVDFVGVVVKMTNHNVYSLITTWNVVITVHGSRESDRIVLVGAPRDSLNAGAVSPGSGNAVFLEIIRALGLLLSNGWTPYRTLVLASFGGEQFGSVGSSHWIDRFSAFENANSGRGVVYLHLDDVVRGAGALRCKASATIRKNIYLMTAAVAQPKEQSYPAVNTFYFANASNSSTSAVVTGSASKDEDDLDILPINATFSSTKLPEGKSNSVFAYWLEEANKKMSNGIEFELPPMDRNLGGRISPFLGRLGIPSLELGFDGGYYGVKDTIYFHRAAAELYGSILLSFTDAQFLQYDFTELSRELRRGQARLEEALDRADLTQVVSVKRLHDATSAFEAAAVSVSREMNVISDQELEFSRVREVNNRLLRAQRAFLLPSGLMYMPWIKNVLYGISEWDDYRITLFPGITHELKRGNAMTVRRELIRLCRIIEIATNILLDTPGDE
ncbi:putative PA domain, transferrin receptor-like, dimerization domain, peptidase M28 [Plasmopara halstedii]